MIIDFQHHYTPPALLKSKKDEVSVGIDDRGNPMHLLNPLLGDIDAHVRMMDLAGLDAAVLSSMVGFDQPDLGICQTINDDMREVEKKHPGRFIGLAHVPALKGPQGAAELKRCRVELGFPGVVIASELQGFGLDNDELRPFWKAAADLGMYVFIHPLPRVIAWDQVYADDLGRMLGWEFSLMVATVRIINSGLLDDLPGLNIQFAHFAGGIGRYLGRVRGFQQRDKWGTSGVKGHSRRPPKPTDYPQAVRTDQEVADYVKQVRELGPNERAMLEGLNVEKLIPDAKERLAKRTR